MLRRLVRAVAMATMAVVAARTAFPAPIPPSRTFNVRETVAARQAVASMLIDGDSLHMLITDRAPTGSSALMLRVDKHGLNRQWVDLKTPAVSLVKVNSAVAASAPAKDGLRLLLPTGFTPRVVELAGETAAVSGDASNLVRLLRTGDLAVQKTAGGRIGEARVLPTAATLKVDSVCDTCGPGLIIPSAYVFSTLPAGKVAAVHRGTAVLKVLDIDTGKLLRSVVLGGEDVDRGRSMYAALPQPPQPSSVSQPTLVISGAVGSSGDMFLLMGPFTPAEGARVVRIDADGAVVGSLRCGYEGFKAEDGPPQFVAVDDKELYLASRAGHVRVYPLTGMVTP